MDKNAIKKFATWARRELVDRVTQRSIYYGVSAEEMAPADSEVVNGRVLGAREVQQRAALVAAVERDGFTAVMEEAAYTWFNRLIALRFMEVNEYLPARVRVFTDANGALRPELLTMALDLDLPGLEMDRVYAYREASDDDGLYRYLLTVQCNALGAVLPGMFTALADYTELLLPDGLLRESSVIAHLVTDIAAEDWRDQVQIIGWLYQYYNSEKKDEVFAALKKNVKITRDNIPAATQLFTPDWIVRYMVENSLGRLWLAGHPSADLQTSLRYYLEDAEQTEEVAAQLAPLRESYAALEPAAIRCIDPCAGSGHVLAYLFDVLMAIYTSYGYTARDAVASILTHNLYGLDIDERAAQLAYFTVMMKAREYDRRFLAHPVQPHVYAIAESNGVAATTVDYFAGGDEELRSAIEQVIADLHDAREYGSIITVTPQDWDRLNDRLVDIEGDISIEKAAALTQLRPLVNVAQTLAMQYDVVVTNPPYMGAANMDAKLSAFVKKNYPNSKSDLFAAFIERGNNMVKANGLNCMVTMQSWMFLSSFEKMRTNILQTRTITHLMHMDNMVLGIAFGTAVAILQNNHVAGYKGTYCHIKYEDIENDVPRSFPVAGNRFAQISADNFAKIPGSPVAYWVSNRIFEAFANDKIGKYAISDGQTKTGNNDKYLRLLWEVDKNKVGKGLKWVIHAKGGAFRRWYGNIDTLIDWSDEARKHYRLDRVARIAPEYIWFRKGICWTLITSSSLHGFRFLDENSTFNLAAPSVFFDDDDIMYYVLGFLNTKLSNYIISLLNPTLNTNISDITSQPIIYNEGEEKRNVINLVKENISLAKADWDSFETSWDFQRHPLVCPGCTTVAAAFAAWERECTERFSRLRANEEELNRIFIGIYGLGDELTPDVAERDVTVRRADLGREVRSLLSYAVGCMLGRYGLDEPGLVYAGGAWDPSRYRTFPADADNVIPICDDEYFTDDIVGRFVEFVRVVYGEATLEENLSFIAAALGGTGAARDTIRSYFRDGFYADHCRIYQRRPIYWQFDSGRRGAFRALVYLHRYAPDTIARVRTDYVHEQQSRYASSLETIERTLDTATGPDRVRQAKRARALETQLSEIHTYEETIHHLADQMLPLDLDAGVKANYAQLAAVLAKIK